MRTGLACLIAAVLTSFTVTAFALRTADPIHDAAAQVATGFADSLWAGPVKRRPRIGNCRQITFEHYRCKAVIYGEDITLRGVMDVRDKPDTWNVYIDNLQVSRPTPGRPKISGRP